MLEFVGKSSFSRQTAVQFHKHAISECLVIVMDMACLTGVDGWLPVLSKNLRFVSNRSFCAEFPVQGGGGSISKPRCSVYNAKIL